MTTMLTALSVLVAWTLLGVVFVGLFLMVKSLQSIRHWLEKDDCGRARRRAPDQGPWRRGARS